jgi:cytochrome o ubiquinol oxidase operon protein cyoD
LSAQHSPAVDAHGHHDHHEHGHDHDNHGSLKTYVIGFVLSVILTAIPFWMVMKGTFESSETTSFVILAFAAVQIVVHMVYFLHMNAKSEGGWNLLSLIFTVLLVGIVLSGSIWVMYHLHHNMMPGSMHEVHESFR